MAEITPSLTTCGAINETRPVSLTEIAPKLIIDESKELVSKLFRVTSLALLKSRGLMSKVEAEKLAVFISASAPKSIPLGLTRITPPVAFRLPNISVLDPPVIRPTIILSTVGWLIFTVSLL